jgi:hypothetical protein
MDGEIIVGQPSNTIVKVDPASQTVDVTDKATADIAIENVQDLGGFEFELHFDPNIVQIADPNDVKVGAFPTSTGRTAVPLGPNIDNTNGILSYGCATFGVNPGPNGNGVLANITFTPQSGGTTPLDIVNVTVTNTEPRVIPIADVIDGEIRVGDEDTVTITSVTADPMTVDPGGEVQLNAEATDSQGHNINYSWTVNPSEGTFDNPNQKSPKWTAPQTPGDYIFTVTATCSEGESDTGDVTVTVSCVCPEVGDVSGDGTISAYDAALIMQFVVGLIDHFPYESKQSPITSTLQSYSITAPHLSVATGNKIQVPIIINDASGVESGGLVLRYDPKILRATNVVSSSLLSGYYWQFNTELSGEVRIAFAGNGIISEDGDLFYVEFEALPNNTGKVSPLILEIAQISENLDITKFNGSIAILPEKSTLLQNYPNPFNPETWVPYLLVEPANATLKIYSTTGKLVRTLDLGYKDAGIYLNKGNAAYWDGKDEHGDSVASGVYFYSLQAGKFNATRKMVIVK